MRKFSAKIGVTALSVLAAFAISVPNLHAETLKVNCDKGNQTIQKALDSAVEGDTIQVSGTCNERVKITTDSINLDGGGAFDASMNFMDGATIDGTSTSTTLRAVVTIEADKVVVHGFIIQNAESNGFHVRRAGSAWIYGNLIRDNPSNGINANMGSFVRIGASARNHSEIGTPGAEGNIIEYNRRGINASANSEVRVSHNIIRNNTRDGIILSEGVTARIDANQITGNSHDGIDIRTLAIVRTGNDTNHGFSDVEPVHVNNLVEGNGRKGLLCTDPAMWLGEEPDFGVGNGCESVCGSSDNIDLTDCFL